jgi:predicted CopG family antitoxin
MNTKLTLTVEQEVIQKAKEYAKKHNRSLSDIIENYLKRIVNEGGIAKKEEQSSLVKELRGSYHLSSDVDYQSILEERRNKKFLK